VSLRHANLEVDLTRTELNHLSATREYPTSAIFRAVFLISNDGARAGLVEMFG
jgi:hypothetical protein